MKTKLTRHQIRARSFHFAQAVADYFMAYGVYPALHEMRVMFLYSTRKAVFY